MTKINTEKKIKNWDSIFEEIYQRDEKIKFTMTLDKSLIKKLKGMKIKISSLTNDILWRWIAFEQQKQEENNN